MVSVDGQRVCVRRNFRILRRAAEVSISRAVLGRDRSDYAAADIYCRRVGATEVFRLAVLCFWGVAYLHSDQAGDVARRGITSGAEHLCAYGAKVFARRAGFAWRQVFCSCGWQA